jgi:CRP/FNR family cyclic AMP-dependent transcriptional regulator
MISPETLRRYPLFASLSEDQLKKLAMITDEQTIENDVTIFNEGETANTFYFLLEGSIDLFYKVGDPETSKQKEILIYEINPGEPFSISALIEPHKLTATARTAKRSTVLKMAATDINQLCSEDSSLSCICIRRVAQAAFERLKATRTLLAAARV